MFDIADKKALKDEICENLVHPYIHLDLNNLHGVRQKIENCIRTSMENVVEQIINHLYTTKEFEEDIGLSK